MKKLFQLLFCAVTVFTLGTQMVFADEAAHQIVNESLPVWSIIPFVGMLLSIAVLPLVKPEFWERNMLKVALAWALVFLIPFTVRFGIGETWYRLLESVVLDFIPFIILLFGLFVVAGGIAIKGTIRGTPKMNVLLLFIGTVLASWVGTTGAAMLLIRPVIRANAWRERKAHVIIFFIFLVANIGGSLTPLGDPPLFMGFQRGVPFLWTTTHLLPILIVNAVILLTVFYIFDLRNYRKEIAEGKSPDELLGPDGEKEKLKLEGAHNILFLAMIIAAVILSGVLPFPEGSGLPLYDEATLPWGSLIEMILILLAAFLSLKTTNASTRELNEFNYGPIEEVAKLFIGIFITMIPALAILQVHGADLGLTEPWQMFWSTGILSSFLDNTPTYLVFLQTAGSLGASEGVATTVGVIPVLMLKAISAGAVFMGANTYIGNAPNFMVKSIAEEYGIRMPSFFGYMLWSVSILIPTFLIDMIIFFM